MNRLSHIICIFLSLTALSCVREDFPYEALDEAVETVEVSLDLFVARESAGTAETKAIDDPADASATKIRNINILQFDGTDESAPIVGEVRYLSDEADPNDEERYLNLDKIRLADSQGEKHTIVILANTFTKLPQVDNLGEMRALFRTFDKESEVFGYNGDGKDFPGEGSTVYYQRLNAIAVTEITNGTIIKGALRRSMARLDINITNNGADGLSIKTVQLMNVSRKDYYITDYRYIDSETDIETKLYDEAFQDVYDPADPKRMNYDAVAWNGNPDGTGTAKYTFYVPANQRGTHEANLLPQEKNRCPNSDGATFLRITGTYGTSGETFVIYSFYLGGNLYNDFNLKPNTSYTYNLSFTGKGNDIVDDRIEDLSTVNFNVDANCYILNPPPAYSRSYTFNAIHRPNVFWGERYGLNAEYPNYTIDATKEWKATVLWSDFEMTQEEVDAFLVRKSGNGSGNYMSDSQRIKVTVPAGMNGNIIVGMYIDNPDNILWSWHLWITDYQPDNIEKHAPIDGKFVYPVTGGEVHRYNGISWTEEDGRYRNGYVMDRNLGALDQLAHFYERGGGMVYQFGRKDPFIGQVYPYWTYDTSGQSTMVSEGALPSIATSSPELSGNNGANVPYSVNHPKIMIYDDTGTSASWNFNDTFFPEVFDPSIEWNDPRSTERRENEELGKNSDKSIFDPCPEGWRVPNAGTEYYNWNAVIPIEHWAAGFTTDDQNSNTTNPDVNFQRYTDPYGRGDGYTYFPNGYLASKDDPSVQTAFFPYVGTRDGHGNYADTGWKTWYWACNIQNYFNGEAMALEMCSWGHSWMNGCTSRAQGCSIRCVREDY